MNNLKVGMLTNNESRSRGVAFISIDLECELADFQEFLRKLLVRQSFHFTFTSMVSRHHKLVQPSHTTGRLLAGDFVALLSVVKH